MQQDDFAVVITQLLGRVSSDDLPVLCQGDPYGNSTRWVFDVEQDTARARSFSFQLRSWHNKGVFAPIVSFSLTPLSVECWDAKPFIEQPKLPTIRISTQQSGFTEAFGTIKYRVALDIVHSTTR
jgi:hypothetical protein